MASIAELRAAMKEAKAAWKNSDNDKELKKKFKAAKEALAAAKAEPKAEEPEAEEPKVDIDALRAAVKEARKAFKADKTDKKAKKKLKQAKADLAAAEAAAEAPAEAAAPEPAAAEPTPMEETTNDSNDFLSNLKAKKPKHTSENPPSTRLFLGNLSYDIDDDACKEFFKDCG